MFMFLKSIIILPLLLLALSLTTVIAEVPSNDRCVDTVNTPLEPGVAVMGDTQEANFDFNTQGVCGYRGSERGLWYRIIGVGSEVTVSVCNNNDVITDFGIFYNCNDQLCLGHPTQQNQLSPCSENKAIIFQFLAEVDEDYHIHVRGDFIGSGKGAQFTIMYYDTQQQQSNSNNYKAELYANMFEDTSSSGIGWGSEPYLFTPFDDNNKMFFWAFGSYATGFGYTDGSTDTDTTTIVTRDFFERRTQQETFVGVLDDKILFFADDDNNGAGLELWISDGTSNGTSLLKDINPGQDSSFHSWWTYPTFYFIPFKNKLYFVANDGSTGNELWVTDGTEVGTQLVIDLLPNPDGTMILDEPLTSSPRSFIVVNDDVMYFIANINNDNNPNTHDSRLFVSDGTADGTQMLIDTPITVNTFSGLFEFQGMIYFTSDYQLWKTDGTQEGTEEISVLTDGTTTSFQNMYDFIVFNNEMYFTDAYTRYLWKTDGTTDGTILVESTPVIGLTPIGDDEKLIYWNRTNVCPIPNTLCDPTDVIRLVRPYVTDGTPGNSVLLHPDLNFNDPPGPERNGFEQYYESNYYGLNINRPFVNFEGRTYFAAVYKDEIAPNLWSTDGTTMGTRLVAEIELRDSTLEDGTVIPETSFPLGLTVFKGALYFSARTIAEGRELWRLVPSSSTGDGSEEPAPSFAPTPPPPPPSIGPPSPSFGPISPSIDVEPTPPAPPSLGSLDTPELLAEELVNSGDLTEEELAMVNSSVLDSMLANSPNGFFSGEVKIGPTFSNMTNPATTSDDGKFQLNSTFVPSGGLSTIPSDLFFFVYNSETGLVDSGPINEEDGSFIVVIDDVPSETNLYLITFASPTLSQSLGQSIIIRRRLLGVSISTTLAVWVERSTALLPTSSPSNAPSPIPTALPSTSALPSEAPTSTTSASGGSRVHSYSYLCCNLIMMTSLSMAWLLKFT